MPNPEASPTDPALNPIFRAHKLRDALNGLLAATSPLDQAQRQLEALGRPDDAAAAADLLERAQQLAIKLAANPPAIAAPAPAPPATAEEPGTPVATAPDESPAPPPLPAADPAPTPPAVAAEATPAVAAEATPIINLPR